MKNKKKVVLITFFNNYTGSPHVLSIVAKELVKRGYCIDIITNKGDGFLSDIDKAKYVYIYYKWSESKIFLLINFILAQVQLFFKVLFYKKANTVFYINTISPIGAVWACKFTNKNYFYHVHENMFRKKFPYVLYRITYHYCNNKSIFVSDYVRKKSICIKDYKVIYNSLSESFSDEAHNFIKESSNSRYNRKNILMIASLKKYKGIYEFAEISRRMPQYTFELVLSATEEELSLFRKEVVPGPNLLIYPLQKNLHPFYQRARLLLQLSHPNSWIETFGLTILEGMHYAIPAIVPNVGGPIELIKNGLNGFCVDPLDLQNLIEKIEIVMLNDDIYKKFSDEALLKSKDFNLKCMIDQVEEYILK